MVRSGSSRQLMINQHTAHSHGPVTWASRARGRLAYGNRKVKSEVAGQPSIQFLDGPPAQREPRCGGTPPNRHRSARSGPFHRRSDGQGRLRRQVGRAYSYVAVDDDEAGARGGTTRSAAGWTGGSLVIWPREGKKIWPVQCREGE